MYLISDIVDDLNVVPISFKSAVIENKNALRCSRFDVDPRSLGVRRLDHIYSRETDCRVEKIS